MRALPLCLLALMLTGCSLHKLPEAVDKKPLFSQPNNPVHNHSTLRASQVKIYNNAADLVNIPFRDLGEISAEDCQNSPQDPLPTIQIARKQMQIRAIRLEANAVLLQKCEIITAMPGCYRQAVCQGSALRTTQ